MSTTKVVEVDWIIKALKINGLRKNKLCKHRQKTRFQDFFTFTNIKNIFDFTKFWRHVVMVQQNKKKLIYNASFEFSPIDDA